MILRGNPDGQKVTDNITTNANNKNGNMKKRKALGRPPYVICRWLPFIVPMSRVINSSQ